MEKTSSLFDEAPIENSSNAQGRQRLSSKNKMVRQKASQVQRIGMTHFSVVCKWCEGQNPPSGGVGHFYSTVPCEAVFFSARVRSPNITTVEGVRITTGVWKTSGCPMCCQCIACNRRVEAWVEEEENNLLESATVLSSMHKIGTGTGTGTGAESRSGGLTAGEAEEEEENQQHQYSAASYDAADYFQVDDVALALVPAAVPLPSAAGAPPLKSQHERYEELVAKAVAIEERCENGSGRFRLPAVTSKEGTEFVTTVWPADTDPVVVHKLLFVSLIARMVRFKPATARGEPQDMLVVWCNCRAFTPTDENAGGSIGFSVDERVLETLHLCIAKAASESFSLSEYNDACASLLALSSSSSTSRARSRSRSFVASSTIPALNCVHVSALKNVVIAAESLDDYSARVVWLVTEDLEKISLPVDKNSYVARMVASKGDLSAKESQYIIDKASLRPPPSIVLQQTMAAEDHHEYEELLDNNSSAAANFIWPLLAAVEKRETIVANLVPQVWNIYFKREAGDPSFLYSIVASVPTPRGVDYSAAVLFSMPVYMTSRRRTVCAGHNNYSSSSSTAAHICPELRLLFAATRGSNNIGASSAAADDDDGVYPAADDEQELVDTSCSANGTTLLGGVRAPISTVRRDLNLPPRSVVRPFSLSVCSPCVSNTSCPVCNHAGLLSTDFDAEGVVLFSSGEQIKVDVMKSSCYLCGSSFVYEGAQDNLVVMERSSARNGYKIVLLDEHWLASMGREFFFSRGSFSDTYSIWENNRALISSSIGEQGLVETYKTKFVEYMWQYLIHLIAPNLPPDAMSCATCGSHPKMLVFDGVAIGLLRRIVKTQFHTVPQGQAHFEKMLFKTSAIYKELALLSGSTEVMKISESLHFYANGEVKERPPAGQGQQLRVVAFAFSHLSALIDKVRDESTKDPGGACTALKFILEHEFNARAAVTFPQQPVHNVADQQQPHRDDGRGENLAAAIPAVVAVVPNPQTPVSPTPSLKAFLHTLGSKSAASITGAPASTIMYAYAALTAGLNASTTIVPKVLLSLLSVADLSVLRADVFIATAADKGERDAAQYAMRTDPLTDRRHELRSNRAFRELAISLRAVGIEAINDVNHQQAPPLPSRNISTSISSYIAHTLRAPMWSLIDHILCSRVTAPDRVSIDSYNNDEAQVTVLQIVARVYPALHTCLVQNSYVLPAELRPILAHLVSKIGILFLRDDTYVVAKKSRIGDKPIFESRYYTPPFAHERGTFACFTRNSLIGEYADVQQQQQTATTIFTPTNRANIRKKEILEMLGIISETFQRVATTLREEQQCGAVTSQRYRLKRTPSYVIDYLHANNASKKSSPFRADRGNDVPICQKEFPSSQHFTPGIMTVTCACSQRKVLHANFMDQYESPLSPFEILTNRFPDGCPEFVIYDNGCHLLMYCMQREPSWFWACRFVVDKFHEVNHVESCCSSIHASSYKTGPLTRANTQAVEQLNNVLRTRVESRLRFMNLDHAVVFLMVFLAQFNSGSRRA